MKVPESVAEIVSVPASGASKPSKTRANLRAGLFRIMPMDKNMNRRYQEIFGRIIEVQQASQREGETISFPAKKGNELISTSINGCGIQ